MRMVLPLVLVFAMAGSAQAQQAPAAAADNTPAVEARLAPVPSAQQVQPAPTDVKPIQTTESRATGEATNTAVADEAIVRQDPTNRNWWWLVGAIVLGGIILAAIL
jgi:hypothetical protein